MHESISKKTQMKLYKSEEGFEKIMGWYDRVKSEITVQHQSIYAETRFGQSHAILAGEENSKAVILIPNSLRIYGLAQEGIIYQDYLHYQVYIKAESLLLFHIQLHLFFHEPRLIL